jgi:hypothetical protein
MIASSAAVACDVGGTIWMSHSGRYDRMSDRGYQLAEMNPLLGHEPSPATLVGAAVAVIGLNYAVLESPLPAWVKSGWFGVLGAAEAYTLAGNARWTGACGVAWTHDAGIFPAR